MSSWNSHNLTNKDASDINCLPHTMQFWNFSPGNLKYSSHTGSCETSDSQWPGERQPDWWWVDLGLKDWGCSFVPFAHYPEWERLTTHYQKARTEEASWKRRKMSSRKYNKSSCLQVKHQDLIWANITPDVLRWYVVLTMDPTLCATVTNKSAVWVKPSMYTLGQ